MPSAASSALMHADANETKSARHASSISYTITKSIAVDRPLKPTGLRPSIACAITHKCPNTFVFVCTASATRDRSIAEQQPIFLQQYVPQALTGKIHSSTQGYLTAKESCYEDAPWVHIMYSHEEDIRSISSALPGERSKQSDLVRDLEMQPCAYQPNLP